MRGTRPTHPQRPRRGMTLVELLVVIVLLTTLVTTAIPIISPGGDDRKIREASRGVNAYLQGAQARAIQTGRPYGVAFRRLSADTDNPEHNAVCAQLRYVEVPPAYSGVDDSSLVRLVVSQDTNGIERLALQLVRYGSNTVAGIDRLPAGYDLDLVPDAFFQPGDLVEIDGGLFELLDPAELDPQVPFLGNANFRLNTLQVYQPGSATAGYLQSLNADQAGYVFLAKPLHDAAISLRPAYDWTGAELAPPEAIDYDGLGTTVTNPLPYLCTTPKPYKVYRQPTLAGGEPLELPAGVAIDLQGSVFGNEARVYSPEYDYDGSPFRLRTDDFMVLFSPEGHIHRVHGVYRRASESSSVEAVDSQPVSSYLALLIGRRELIPAAPQGVTGTPTYEDYAEPIPINVNDYNELLEAEAREVTDQYNWLNLESRWVVIGGQSGAVTSIDNSGVYPSAADADGNGTVSISEQLTAALENAPRRSASGGR